MIIEEHTSPDGLLRFVVDSTDGDLTLGFADCSWHTHGDLLASMYGVSEAAAAERFVANLTRDEAVIAISRIGGEIKDIWVTDDPSDELRHAADGETVELRMWSGQPWPSA